MKSRSRAALAAGVFCALVATPALAVTFNFSGNGGLSPTYMFSEDGIDLTVTPASITIGPTIPQDTVAIQGQVGQYSGGLGISQNGNENHQIDGSGVDELLIMAFSTPVEIVSAEFRYVSSNDDFEFWHDSGNDDSLNGDYIFSADIPGTLIYTFAGGFISDLFGIGATHYSDDFKLYAVTVSPVPLPAALPLFAGALGLFGAARWRRRNKAAA